MSHVLTFSAFYSLNSVSVSYEQRRVLIFQLTDTQSTEKKNYFRHMIDSLDPWVISTYIYMERRGWIQQISVSDIKYNYYMVCVTCTPRDG